MFDLGMSELLVIGVVALVVIGPKDLPQLFRSLGKFTAKMRAMAREFSRAMEAAADEAGVKDVAKDLKDATSAKSLGIDKVREAAEKFEKWDPMKNAARPTAKLADAKPADAAPTDAKPAADEKPRGPATAALAEQQAARQAVAREAAEKLRKPVAAPAEPAAPAAAAKPKAARKPASPKAKTTKSESPPTTPKADA